MKKTSILLCSLAIAASTSVYSFSQQQPKKPVAKKTTQTAAAKSGPSKQDIEEGKQLLSKSDCLACHQLQVKVVGPAYAAIAEKYPETDANFKHLIEKIIKGGAGVWGQIPMPPHPSLAEADAKKMVSYILSLDAK